eukprot:EG_transcript_1448
MTSAHIGEEVRQLKENVASADNVRAKCFFLLNLTRSHDGAAADIVEAGALDVLFTAIVHHGDDPATVEAAAVLYTALGERVEAAQRANAGVSVIETMVSVIQALESEAAQTVVNLCKALQFLISGNLLAVEAALSQNVIPLALRLMETPNGAAVALAASQVLTKMTILPSVVHFLAEDIRTLINITKSRMADDQVLIECLRLLVATSAESLPFSSAPVCSSILPVVLDVLGQASASSEAQGACWEALRHLLTGSVTRQELFIQHGGHTIVTDLLRAAPADLPLQRQGLELLCVATEHWHEALHAPFVTPPFTQHLLQLIMQEQAKDGLKLQVVQLMAHFLRTTLPDAYPGIQDFIPAIVSTLQHNSRLAPLQLCGLEFLLVVAFHLSLPPEHVVRCIAACEHSATTFAADPAVMERCIQLIQILMTKFDLAGLAEAPRQQLLNAMALASRDEAYQAMMLEANLLPSSVQLLLSSGDTMPFEQLKLWLTVVQQTVQGEVDHLRANDMTEVTGAIFDLIARYPAEVEVQVKGCAILGVLCSTNCLFDEGQKAQAMELLIGSLQSAACPMAVLQAVLPAMAAMATDRAKRRDFASVIAALALRLPDMTRLCLVSALQLLHHSAPSHADLMFGNGIKDFVWQLVEEVDDAEVLGLAMLALGSILKYAGGCPPREAEKGSVAILLAGKKHSETRLVVLSCLLALSDVIAALPSVRLALCPHVPWLVALQLQNTANSPLQVTCCKFFGLLSDCLENGDQAVNVVRAMVAAGVPKALHFVLTAALSKTTRRGAPLGTSEENQLLTDGLGVFAQILAVDPASLRAAGGGVLSVVVQAMQATGDPMVLLAGCRALGYLGSGILDDERALGAFVDCIVLINAHCSSDDWRRQAEVEPQFVHLLVVTGWAIANISLTTAETRPDDVPQLRRLVLPAGGHLVLRLAAELATFTSPNQSWLCRLSSNQVAVIDDALPLWSQWARIEAEAEASGSDDSDRKSEDGVLEHFTRSPGFPADRTARRRSLASPRSPPSTPPNAKTVRGRPGPPGTAGAAPATAWAAPTGSPLRFGSPPARTLPA